MTEDGGIEERPVAKAPVQPPPVTKNIFPLSCSKSSESHTNSRLKDTEDPDARIGRQLIDVAGFRFDKEWTAVRQIELLGLDPNSVTDCVVGHLDPDHIGGLADFPNATVHVGLEEYENFKRGGVRYLQHQLDHRPPIETYGSSHEKWFGLEARRIATPSDVEIYLIPLFGHTIGHCGVALNCGADWILYVGDAYYLRAEVTDREHPVHEFAAMRADDNLLRMESLKKISQFITENPTIEVFSYHDAIEFPAFTIKENKQPSTIWTMNLCW